MTDTTFYDSYEKKLKSFPSHKKINMYVCGLTPYDQAHIGHLRTYVAFDTLKRFLNKSGYEVFHIQNITDVDDKIIKRCKETGSDPKKLPKELHEEALLMFDKMNILRANIYPKVTEHIKEIIEIIQKLITNEYAYETKTGVYYRVSKFKKYGKLSGQNLEQVKDGSRFAVDETKENPEDFALWKKTDGEIIEFASPWGKGRPGWHIECSAMAGKYAKKLHIHGGARDLIFPHHENEIAQSEGATNEKLSEFWMHTGFLTVNGEKMSKSLGNFTTIKEIKDKFSANAIRLFMLNSHYRSPVDYNEQQIESSEESVERIFNCLGLIKEEMKFKKDRKEGEFEKKTEKTIKEIYQAFGNDLDTPTALAKLFDLVREINKHLNQNEIDKMYLLKLEKQVQEILWIFGLKEQNKKANLDDKEEMITKLVEEFGGKTKKKAEQDIEQLILIRKEAKNRKDYKKSDLIRLKLKEIGIILEDSGSDQRWKIE